MDNYELIVKESQVQAVIKNLQGCSFRMDVETKDVTDKQYDVELQRSDSGAKPKRARYNSSLMDANAVLPGVDAECLPETYVIFITENDVLGNIFSPNLTPVYRQQCGSVNPTGIIEPAIAATFVSTAVAVVYCKAMDRRRRV